jgi:hypothetical protein
MGGTVNKDEFRLILDRESKYKQTTKANQTKTYEFNTGLFPKQINFLTTVLAHNS